MKHYITIALCTFLSQMCTGQVMMLFSQDSLTGIVSPLDVDSLFYWFAADVGVTDSLGGAIATDEGVGSWLDLSGRGHHVTQSTNGARPVYKATGGPGGYPCIQFDGTNDFLTSAAHWWGSDDLTVFVVMKFGNATRDAQEIIVAKWQATSPLRQWALDGSDAASSYNKRYIASETGGGASVSTGTLKQANYAAIVWRSEGSGTPELYEDGSPESVSGTTVGIVDGSSTKLSLGCLNVDSTPANFILGSISEIIVYSRALTATERTAIENYLNRKYDLY